MGFRLRLKPLTLNDLKRQFIAVSLVTKRLMLESRGFCYKVALYLSYLHVKFDDEIVTESLRISRIICD